MKTQTDHQLGFTVVELMVVVGIIGILAAMAIGLPLWGRRNANVDGVAVELAVRLAGLRAAALTDGRDRLLVYADPGAAGRAEGRVVVLTSPSTGWTLSSFDVTRPGAGAIDVDVSDLPSGMGLLASATGYAPRPLQAVKLNDPAMLSTCGGASCFAIRFTGDGDVRGENPAGGTSSAPGFAFVLASLGDQGLAAGAGTRGIAVGFPTGIVKSYVP